MKKTDLFWQTYLNLEKELIEVSKYVYITLLQNYILRLYLFMKASR